MNFHQLLHDVVRDTLSTSLPAVRPELTVCATIVLLLLVRMLVPGCRSIVYYVMLFGTATALWLAIPWQGIAASGEATPLFTGMLVSDSFSISLRVLLLVFVLLYIGFTRVSGVPDPDDAAEFYILVLGATLGMCLMISANHLVIILLGIEMASVPSYVLAGFRRQHRDSSEAALKYAVYGAGAAGVMLYGLSLLAGALGSAHLPTMARNLAALLQSGGGTDHYVVLVLGGLMLMVGLAF
ncbi:MAG: proton-conducting transporter membrane subunit, partial [Thermoguttaceae bacterium]